MGKNFKNYGKVKLKLVKHGNQKIAIFHLIKGHNSGTTNGIIIKLGQTDWKTKRLMRATLNGLSFFSEGIKKWIIR